MAKYLWTGESEFCFCICGHHLTDHETSQWLIPLTGASVVTCRGGGRPRIIRNCECDEFRPYRVVGQEGNDEEVIEKQNYGW